MSFRRVGVVGLGTMGAGIAEVLARGDFQVVGVEVNDAALLAGRGHLEKSTGRAVRRGRMTEPQQRALLDRIVLSTDYGDLADCDLVVEAVPERLELKQAVFAELDRVCRDDAVLATNTSSLSVTEIAVATNRAESIVGVHFFNPAPVMKLVEIIGTVLTRPEALAAVEELVAGLGKVGVSIGDRAGFVANRLLFGYLNQAAAMYDSGHAGAADIDTAMKVGCGLPMGPLALMDLIGLDVSLEVCEAIYAETRDRRHAAAPILRQLVAAGLLGRKTGRGFFSGDEAASAVSAVGSVAVVGSGALAGAITATASVEDADVILVMVDSTDSVIEAAVATGRPERVVGLHAVGDLVEVVETAVSAPGTAELALAVVGAGGLGRSAVRCRDRAGFIVDALRMPYLNDAARMLDSGYATPDAIDAAMVHGCGYPIGPVADLDCLGAGRVVAVLDALYASQREPALAPTPLLTEARTAGRSLR
jgi:3-hydroxybutyryl-CoA dehydrogenase